MKYDRGLLQTMGTARLPNNRGPVDWPAMTFTDIQLLYKLCRTNWQYQLWCFIVDLWRELLNFTKGV